MADAGNSRIGAGEKGRAGRDRARPALAAVAPSFSPEARAEKRRLLAALAAARDHRAPRRWSGFTRRSASSRRTRTIARSSAAWTGSSRSFPARIATLGPRARARLHDTGIAGSTVEYPFGLPLSRWLAARLGRPRRRRLGGSPGPGADRGRAGPAGHPGRERRVQRGRLHGAPVAGGGAGRTAPHRPPGPGRGLRPGAARRRDCGTGCSRASGCPIRVRLDAATFAHPREATGGRARRSSGRRSGGPASDVVREAVAAAPVAAPRLPGLARRADRDRARRHGDALAGAPRVLVPERRGRAGGRDGARAAGGADRARAGVPAPVRGLLRVPRDQERRPRRLRRRLVPLRDPGVRVQRLRVLPARGVGLDPGPGPPRVSPRLPACAPWWWIPTSWAPGNPEALRSGAFYFYHRLGFRPRAPAVRRVLEEELAKIARDRSYRSPLPVLRRLARDEVCLTLAGGSPEPERRLRARDLAGLVTRDIARRHGGDREAATRQAVRRVARALGRAGLWPDGPSAERRAFRQWALVTALVPDLDRWPRSSRAQTRPDDPGEGRPGRGTRTCGAFSGSRVSAAPSRRWSARCRPQDARPHPSADRPAPATGALRRVARATPAMTTRAPDHVGPGHRSRPGGATTGPAPRTGGGSP